MSEILLVEHAWGITRLTLNRPENRNALSPALVDALLGALKDAAADESVRVVELTGAGDKIFCAGGDLGGGGLFKSDGVLGGHQVRARFAELLQTIRLLGKPLVGVVNGHALGGGFGLAMACDLVVASEEASFGTPEINVGLFPMIIMSVLERNVPRKRLMELMLTGDRMTAREALQLGCINRVVPPGELRAAADELIQKLAQKSPAVMKLGRDAFYQMEDMSSEQRLNFLNSQLTLNLLTEDAAEGLSAFVQKRTPEWKGK